LSILAATWLHFGNLPFVGKLNLETSRRLRVDWLSFWFYRKCYISGVDWNTGDSGHYMKHPVLTKVRSGVFSIEIIPLSHLMFSWSPSFGWNLDKPNRRTASVPSLTLSIKIVSNTDSLNIKIFQK